VTHGTGEPQVEGWSAPDEGVVPTLVVPRIQEALRRALLAQPHLVVAAPVGSGKIQHVKALSQVLEAPTLWVEAPDDRGVTDDDLVGLRAAVDASPGKARNGVPRRLVVIAGCDRIFGAPQASRALCALLDSLPRDVWVTMLSSAPVAAEVRERFLRGQVRIVGYEELRLTEAETAQFVRTLGGAEGTVRRALEVADGWAAGVVFAVRYGTDPVGRGSGIAPWFEKRLLAKLAEGDRSLLLDASAMTQVTQAACEALWGDQGQAGWERLVALMLPERRTATSLTLNPLVREYFAAAAQVKDARRHAVLRTKYVEHLIAQGRHEDAADVAGECGMRDLAVSSALAALASLCERGDYAKALAWADRLAEGGYAGDDRVLTAELLAAHGLGDLARTRERARRLAASGVLQTLLGRDRGLAAVVASAFSQEQDELDRLLPGWRGAFGADTVRYVASATLGAGRAQPPSSRGPRELDPLLGWALLIQGRLRDYEMSRQIDAGGRPDPNDVVAGIYRGDLRSSQEAWARLSPSQQRHPHGLFARSQLLLAEGDDKASLTIIRQAAGEARRKGFFWADLYRAISGYVLLSMGRVDDAFVLLTSMLDEPAQQPSVRERCQWLLGLCHLERGDPESARDLFAAAMESMAASGRRLYVPTVSLLMAECLTRCGRADEAKSYLAAAYDVADDVDTLYPVLAVGRRFPQVVDSQLIRNLHDARWRSLLFSPATTVPRTGVQAAARTQLYLQPFGADRHVEINGVRLSTKRMKVLEVAACLAIHDGHMSRAHLRAHLLEDADPRSAGNYFRQVVHLFRVVTGIQLNGGDEDVLAVPEGVVIDSADQQYEDGIRIASSSTGERRVAGLRRALALVQGPYLDDSALEWVDDRRRALELSVEEVRLELARLLLADGDLRGAQVECRAVIAANRYCDPAYGILLHVERKLGTESSFLGLYRGVVQAMSELGLRPGDARRLMLAAADGA
jgi:LuxR family transcriptional regulator, maltose regulon positive regulatory protein